MRVINLGLNTLAMFVLCIAFTPERAFAQQRTSSYYQPRVYNSPPPQYSRNTYVTGGRIVGGIGAGVAGTYAGGPYAGRVAGPIGGAVGGYYAGRVYDNQVRYTTQRYYAPPAYGVQTTTPYMTRTVPRY